jgi:hypothetical protein
LRISSPVFIKVVVTMRLPIPTAEAGPKVLVQLECSNIAAMRPTNDVQIESRGGGNCDSRKKYGRQIGLHDWREMEGRSGGTRGFVTRPSGFIVASSVDVSNRCTKKCQRRRARVATMMFKAPTECTMKWFMLMNPGARVRWTVEASSSHRHRVVRLKRIKYLTKRTLSAASMTA